MIDENLSVPTRGESKQQQTPSHSLNSKSQPEQAQQSQFLSATIDAYQFVKPLKRLVSSKRTLELTHHQLDTWVSALAIYKDRPKIVNRAILTLATSDDPFPDLGKLLTLCERLRREIDNVQTHDIEKTKFKRIEELARMWEIDV